MGTVAIWLIAWIVCSVLTAVLFARWASASKDALRPRPQVGFARPIRGTKPGLHSH